jgi:hypothetical protein
MGESTHCSTSSEAFATGNIDAGKADLVTQRLETILWFVSKVTWYVRVHLTALKS